MRGFSRCVDDFRKYLPDIQVPGYIQEISVCLFPRPGTVHGARVAGVKVEADTDPSQVESWIKREKLDSWEGVLIREEKCSPCEMLKPEEKSEDSPKESIEEMTDQELDATVNEILKRIKKKVTDYQDKDEIERKKLELELKKKKLELINKWLEANKD